MQKTILALTCAAFSCGVYADVNLYGQIKSSVSTSQVKLKATPALKKARLQLVLTTIRHASVSKAKKN